jgi:hypothetical protein
MRVLVGAAKDVSCACRIAWKALRNRYCRHAGTQKWKIFGECPVPTQKLKICKDWEERARISPIFSTLHPGRLSFILDMYWNANHMKSNLSFRCFSMSLRKALTQMNAHIRTRPRFTLPQSLTSLLTKRFAIQIEANTSILHRSALIREWQSSDPDDIAFGAITENLPKALTGKNSLVLCLGSDCDTDLNTLKELLPSHLPTRVLCIAPTEKIAAQTQGSRNCLEIVRFEAGLPLTCIDTLQLETPPFSISFGLFMNGESLIFDSLDWLAFKEDICDWSTSHGIKSVIPPFADALFHERTFPTLHTRVFPRTLPQSVSFISLMGRGKKRMKLHIYCKLAFPTPRQS